MFNKIKNWLTTNWQQRWTRAHLAFSPIGVLLVAALLSRSAGVWGWADRDSLGFLADLVPLGVAVYAAAAFVTEQVIRMVFWALAQREKDIEKRRAEGEARGETRGEVRGKRQAREEFLRLLSDHSRDVSPELVSDMLRREAALLENGEVYGGPSLDVYLGRVNRAGLRLMARQSEPPEQPDLWCQRCWRVRLEGHFEDLLPAGRIRGLRLDTTAAEWEVSLD